MSREKKTITFLPENKKCPKCNKVKNKDEFSLNIKSLDGLNSWCTDCRKPYYQEYRHNITQEDYKLMLKSQNGVCAICRQSEIRKQNNKIQCLSVDHSHSTGKIRGLLCSRCNMILGHIENNPEILKEIPKYLEEK